MLESSVGNRFITLQRILSYKAYQQSKTNRHNNSPQDQQNVSEENADEVAAHKKKQS